MLNAAMPVHLSAEIQALKKTLVTQLLQGSIGGTFKVGSAITLSGAGQLTVTGATNLTGKFKLVQNAKTGNATVSGGTASFTDAAGDRVSVSYSGSGKNVNGQLTFTMNGKVTGGAGQFKGVTGTFSGSGTAAELAGTFLMNVVITTKKLV